MTNDTTHLCPACGEVKKLPEFSGRKNRAGLPYPSSYCRSCQSEYNKQWRIRNRERILADTRAKYRDNPEHRAAIRASSARRYASNPDAQRNSYLLAKFGISLVEYRVMDSAQESRCKICGETCKSGRDLAVDHDHATGAVRGLLCIRCNNGLGNFCDRLDLLAAAAQYLS